MDVAVSPSIRFPVPVEQMARLIQRLDRREKARLIRLLPELQTIRPEEADLSAEQETLLAYFDRKRERLTGHRPLREDDTFVGGLTVAEFFGLPERDQKRIWDQAHENAEQVVGERQVREDALPA